MKEMIRLDKFLGEMGVGSRSRIREDARQGRIRVDGTVVEKADIKIDPYRQEIYYDGRRIEYVRYEYYMLNKPQGVVSATEDGRHGTVLDLIDKKKRNDLFPVGRLDIDTEGLLLITNDGELAHRLLSPKKHVDKRYYARIQGQLPGDAAERISAGLVLNDGTPLLPARLEILSDREPTDETHVIVTVREGKFHQIKRMFETLGCRVVYLKRISMGSLTLDEKLKPGQYRELTEQEVADLKR